jgi:hypothetical protein
MGVVFLLGLAFTVWMAVEAVRRGQASGWLWIILVFGPLGAAVYFFSEYVDLRFARAGAHKVSAADLRMAEADVRRLDNSATWLAYASALRARKQYPAAVEAARRAVEHDAASLDAQYELAQALFATGRPTEAIGPLQRVVAVNRSFDSESALFALGRAQLAAGDVEGARASLEEVGTRTSRPEYLYELAALLARLERRDEAARVLQRIITEGELVPPYLKHSVRPWIRKSRQGLRRLGF